MKILCCLNEILCIQAKFSIVDIILYNSIIGDLRAGFSNKVFGFNNPAEILSQTGKPCLNKATITKYKKRANLNFNSMLKKEPNRFYYEEV